MMAVKIRFVRIADKPVQVLVNLQTRTCEMIRRLLSRIARRQMLCDEEPKVSQARNRSVVTRKSRIRMERFWKVEQTNLRC